MFNEAKITEIFYLTDGFLQSFQPRTTNPLAPKQQPHRNKIRRQSDSDMINLKAFE